jgi:hypothetical protein
MSPRPFLLSVLTALAAGALLAQGDHASAQPPRTGVTPPTALGAHPFRVPIHTQPSDERRSAYGTWAAGDAYKASFHDGFVFVPVLGDGYPENLPWRWRTLAVTAGGEPIADVSAPVHRHGEWRYEYDHGGVVEAYDVRPDGVEQSFVVARRPARAGDLVVTGRIDSALAAAPAAAAQQELVFRAANGAAIVRYGAAIAFDAAGRVAPVTTAYDGDAVRLAVGADWLAGATFPVTIDPLTSPVVLLGALVAENLAIHREDESPTMNTMVVYSRVVSSGDRDVYARLVSSDFQLGSTVFADVSASWSSLLPDVTFVGGADRWVVAFWEHSSLGNDARAYFHDAGNLQLNSGVARTHAVAGEHLTFLSIGGRSHPTNGTTALLAYRSDPFYGNSNTTKVWGVAIDAANRAFGGRTDLSPGIADAEAPDVNCQIGWGEDGWVVVYQARSGVLDDYDLVAVRVSQQTFAPSNPMLVGPDDLGDKVRPVVQGWDGRYVIAALQDVTPEINGQHFGRNVIAFRVDMPGFSQPVNVQPHHAIATSAAQDLTHLAIGFDGASRSHWCVTWDNVFTAPGAHLRRIGHQGAVTEGDLLPQSSYHAAVTWNGVAHEFQIACANFDPLQPLLGQRLGYPTSSWHLVYGGSCGPGTITSDTTPLPGSQFYRVLLQNAPPGMPGALFFSGSAGGVDLGAIGAPNCIANLGSIDANLPITIDGNGNASFTMALPNAPLFLGDLYWQFLYLWPAAPTPLPIGVTRGLRASVR